MRGGGWRRGERRVVTLATGNVVLLTLYRKR